MESKILKMTALIASLLAIVSLFINDLLTLGVVAGFLMGAFYLKILVFSVSRITASENISKIKIKSIFGCFLRFLILGIFFWLATFKGVMFFVGTALGFFSLKISIIYLGVKRRLLCRI
jgi:hypothetical protein